MAKITSKAFVEKALDIAKNENTVYMWGTFGQPVTESIIAAKAAQYKNTTHYTAAKVAKLRKLIGKNYFAFDCVGLLKAIIWGWCSNEKKANGGAVYRSNGVDDIGADTMIATECNKVSSSGWTKLTPGEALWCKGHIGIYIGDGLAVEATSAWGGSVQVTAVLNMGAKAGYNGRTWSKHGFLNDVDYSAVKAEGKPAKTLEAVAREVIAGKWGTGDARREKLAAAGYNYHAVQAKVNYLLNADRLEQVAREVIAGKWGTGTARRIALTRALYDYEAVQAKVNELLTK